MHKFSRHYGLPPREFSPAVLDACQRHNWPGNVRELESFVKRYLMIGEEEVNRFAVGNELFGNAHSAGTNVNGNGKAKFHVGDLGGGKSLKALISDVKSEAERNAIAAALERTGWNRKAAARLLKVSYRTMLYKIEQYGMSSSNSFAFPVAGNAFRGNGHSLKGND
jgi:DNA-binding NtrC family response regulator